MTIGDINTDISFLTQTSTTEFTAAQRLIGLNQWYQKIVSMVLGSQDEWDYDDQNYSDFPILTTNLVANQQDYSLPVAEEILKIQRVEITYDGTNWYKAEPLDKGERGLATDSTSVNNDFSTTKPYYDLQYNSVFLYPIPTANSTSGLKIFVIREPDEFTSAQVSTGTRIPGFEAPFHRMLSYGVALDWEMAKKPDSPKIKHYQQILGELELRLRNFYGKRNEDREIVLKSAYTSYE